MVHRRLMLIAASFVVLSAWSCGRKPAEPQQGNAVAPSQQQQPAAPIALPEPEPKLQREQLILAVLRAISDDALGRDDAEAQRALKGREFELRLRFGCPGAASSSRSWSYDDKKGVLRARFDADLDAKSVQASNLLAKGYEGILGFTIERPLLLSAGCPSSEFAAATTSVPTIAVAQLFTADESRVQRPEKSYQITKAVEPAQKPSEGLDVVIGGRLAELSDGRVIHCAPSDGAPACIIGAKFDRVAIENPVSGVVLGQWSQW